MRRMLKRGGGGNVPVNSFISSPVEDIASSMEPSIRRFRDTMQEISARNTRQLGALATPYSNNVVNSRTGLRQYQLDAMTDDEAYNYFMDNVWNPAVERARTNSTNDETINRLLALDPYKNERLVTTPNAQRYAATFVSNYPERPVFIATGNNPNDINSYSTYDQILRQDGLYFNFDTSDDDGTPTVSQYYELANRNNGRVLGNSIDRIGSDVPRFITPSQARREQNITANDVPEAWYDRQSRNVTLVGDPRKFIKDENQFIIDHELNHRYTSDMRHFIEDRAAKMISDQIYQDAYRRYPIRDGEDYEDYYRRITPYIRTNIYPNVLNDAPSDRINEYGLSKYLNYSLDELPNRVFRGKRQIYNDANLQQYYRTKAQNNPEAYNITTDSDGNQIYTPKNDADRFDMHNMPLDYIKMFYNQLDEDNTIFKPELFHRVMPLVASAGNHNKRRLGNRGNFEYLA